LCDDPVEDQRYRESLEREGSEVIESLKARASRQGRSLEAELRVILERAAAERVVNVSEACERAERISRSPGGRPQSDSAALIREDRDR
jgi:plasmid stability protein